MEIPEKGKVKDSPLEDPSSTGTVDDNTKETRDGKNSGESEGDDSASTRANNDSGSTKGSKRNSLDEFLKQAEMEGENLSDQTIGGLCLYDCSILSTPTDKSMSHSHNHGHSFNEGASEVNISNLQDLTCSMLHSHNNLENEEEELVETVSKLKAELAEKDLMVRCLVDTLDRATEHNLERTAHYNELRKNAKVINEHFQNLSSLSQWSMNEGRNNNTENSENFRLSTYIRAIESSQSLQQQLSSQSQCHPEEDLATEQNTRERHEESRSSQTTPVPVAIPEVQSQSNMPAEVVQSLCSAFLTTTKDIREELNTVRHLIKQPYENNEDFPMQKIAKGLQQIIQCHENEVLAFQHQLDQEVKHRHEVQNGLKDEIRTLKMRFQEKIKQRDNEVADLKARLLENDQPAAIDLAGELNLSRPSLDDSFNSNPEEETFSNLTRTKVEYLKLTPSEYVEDEIIEAVHIPDSYRQILEDYKLKLFDMEKKFEANRRYLEEQTHDREVERDEFQTALESLQGQIEELKKENGKLYEVNKQNTYQMEEYDARLKRAEEDEMDMVQKHEKTESELKAAVEKIYELREIIRDLEKQIDVLTTNALQVKEQNQVLLDELEKQEIISKKEQPVFNEQDSHCTLPMDVTDEIQAQLHDLARKIEFKINEMDSFPLHTRPNSSCSGVVSAISTEDISCRELAGRTSRNFENCAVEDIGSLLLNEIRRLESQFESLIRIEDVVMKRLKDSELRCSGLKCKLEELEGQLSIYQEKCSSQILKIADLEGKVDALRFESSNQNVISSLKERLSATSKQLEDCKILLATKEQELSQIKLDFNTMKIKQAIAKPEKKEVFSQTYSISDETTGFADLTYDGVSPEKIRKLDTNNATAISFSNNNNIVKEGFAQACFDSPEYLEASKSSGGRAGTGSCSHSGRDGRDGRGDDGEWDYERQNATIKELDDNLYELQKLLQEKDEMIKSLQREMTRIEHKAELSGGHHKQREKCEEENVIVEIGLNPGERRSPDSGEPSVYETVYASDYEVVENGLLKYMGTKLISDGVRRSLDQGQGRVQETDLQIEIAKLNTQMQQLKRALEDERKRSEGLAKQLQACEESKAELRSSRSPTNTRTPVQNIVSSQSITDYKMQQRELVHQIEDGRALLSVKHKEIIDLKDQINMLETRLTAKVEYEQELITRLGKTSASLRKCEEHGRELSAKNLDNIKEIRRLKDQLDKLHAGSRGSEIYPLNTMSGNEYFEPYMRAKSHKKALAWQKKYLASVILGYKSILRQVGHGSEHPELLQTPIPLAPSAVGLLDKRSPKIDFRVRALAVLAIVRMKYMVNRWHSKRNVEGSPDSEYQTQTSRHPQPVMVDVRVDPNIIRPKGILVNQRSRVQPSTTSAIPFATATGSQLVNVNNSLRGGSIIKPDYAARGLNVNVGDMSEFISRFESIENEIVSSLSRTTFPSVHVNKH